MLRFKMSLSRLTTQTRLLHKLRAACSLTPLRYSSSLRHEGLQVSLSEKLKPKPDPKTLLFGHTFTDHMLYVDWSEDGGWKTPQIVPFQDFSMSPASSCLHYSTECFEGLKAYHCVDEKIRMFRPIENMKRLNSSAVACSLPEVNEEQFLECIKDLIRIDRDWVPKGDGYSLYVRPALIGTDPRIGVHAPLKARLFCILTPTGPYFPGGAFESKSLYADPAYLRSWPGGVGGYKIGGNYGPGIRIQKIATEKGCSQVLWLFGDDHQLTEVGTMNVFVNWINEQGEAEIVTPPLDGMILPGVTRKSLLELGASWGTYKMVERPVTMNQIRSSVKEGRLKEVFGAGTACVVCPINKIQFLKEEIIIPDSGDTVAKRFYKELTDIQYGRTKHAEWCVPID